jgi:hypothetical protein
MNIPAEAVIPADKLTNYLLAPRRKNDKSRFLLRAGFDQSKPEILEAAIRKCCAITDAVADRVDKYGTYYNVKCQLIGPDGAGLPVTLIWLRRLDLVFSFVTLIPDKEARS